MRSKWVLALAASVLLAVCIVATQSPEGSSMQPLDFNSPSQEGEHLRKITDGIYVYVGKVRVPPDLERDSNAGIIITQEGVVLVDTGETPLDARAIQNVVKTLTSQPVRFIILTEPHSDHYTGSFLFSPPAVVITHEPGAQMMKVGRESVDSGPIKRLMAGPPEMRAALEGYRFVVPQVEYREKMTLNVGERTIELLYLKNFHSVGDTAIWLPNERVLFSAGGIVVDQFPIVRSFVTVPDVLDVGKMLKGLKPEFVVPGHGIPGTVKIFEDTERYWALMLDRVGQMAKDGKSPNQIKAELRMPEYEHWGSKDRFSTNVQAAFEAICSPRAMQRIFPDDPARLLSNRGTRCRIP